MPEKTLILTVGLPRSGKSTWALSTGLPIVNRDSIRLAIHGQPYIQEAEDLVSAIEYYMVKALFLAGHNEIIIDATNLDFEKRKPWVKQSGWKTKLKIFDVSKDICIERAKASNRPDLIPVIERMAENHGSLRYLVEGGVLYDG